MVERVNGAPNAIDVAQAVRDNGYVGSWVLMIGTNDAANIAAGAARQADERIVAMMSVLGADRVLWIDALTLATTGFWASQNIGAWDDALAAAREESG